MTDEFKLGDQEAIVLQAVAVLPPDQAYGIPIMDFVTEATGKEPALGALYTVLARLEKKGFVTWRMSEPTAERGGRRKKIYEIEAAGQRALTEKFNQLDRRVSILRPLRTRIGDVA